MGAAGSMQGGAPSARAVHFEFVRNDDEQSDPHEPRGGPARQENTKTLEMLQQICQHLGLPTTADDELHKLSERTDIDQLATELARQLPGKQP